MDLTWALMVGTTKKANLSNSSNLKFVKVLNNDGVAHIVPKNPKHQQLSPQIDPPILPSYVN
jgi:hypothetical protein